MKIAVIGAGNGGQAIAGFLGLKGYHVTIYDRNPEKIMELQHIGGVHLTGRIVGYGKVSHFTTDIVEAVSDADIIMITTVANAHQDIAASIASSIKDNQILVLNPGRTCGALVFDQTLKRNGCKKRYYLCEAQTLMYACRIVHNGTVNIIGVKDEVLLSALPTTDTQYILDKLTPLYQCFRPANNVLQTSLENIGAIFHPCVLLFNAATIERKDEFYFYRDMTPKIADFIEAFDAERLAVGEAFNIKLLGVNDWISFAYKGTKGNSLCEKMKNNPAYYDIKSPSSIYTRQLMEDIPTGVLPIMELGVSAGLEMNLFKSMINISTSLLSVDFRTNGRTLESMGLSGMTKEEILNYIS